MTGVVQVGGADFWALASLPVGVGLELAFGDRGWWPRPVTLIRLVVDRVGSKLTSATARAGGNAVIGDNVGGVLLMLATIGGTGATAWFAVDLASAAGGPASFAVRTTLIALGMSTRRTGERLFRASARGGNPSAAMAELATIDDLRPARWPSMSAEEACLAMAGEKLVDAVVAPLFWFAALGPAGLWACVSSDLYRRWTEQNPDRLDRLGATARGLDNLLKYVPARLTWLLLTSLVTLVGEDARGAWRGGRGCRGGLSRPVLWGQAALGGAIKVRFPAGRVFGAGQRGRDGIIEPTASPPDRSAVTRAVRIMQVVELVAAALGGVARIFA